MAWKNQKTLHIDEEIWHYVICKPYHDDANIEVLAKGPDKKTHRFRFIYGEQVTPSLVKEYIQENILARTIIHS